MVPKRFEGRDGICPSAIKEVTKSKKVSRLVGIGQLPHRGFEGCDGCQKIFLVIVNQTNVQLNPSHFGGQSLGCVEHCEGLRPFFAAHGNYGKVGVGSGYVGIDRQHLPEFVLGLVELAIAECGFSGFKDFLRILSGNWCGFFGLSTASADANEKNKQR